ncbi:thyroglobulin-like [Bacillus rossius redtenbacheri]|uniref:thyroglobulin-like n=1 Tax=Bacillus rossius redtenbacheri TaxID=93214 RepID=UPI002FDDC170
MAFVKKTLLLVSLFCFSCSAADITCTEDYCSDYVDSSGCPALPDACNGSASLADYFPSPTTCSCCRTCLVHLGENETCAQGVAGAPTTQSVCGPGLTCTKQAGQERATCQQMSTPCVRLQKAYDERAKNAQPLMTEVRPQCNARGRFAPAHCILGSICYCVAPTGERIFGEQAYTSPSLLRNMTCDCALAAWTAEQLLGAHVSTARCLANGSYDPLQCVGDKCLCVNATAAPVDAVTAHPLFISNATLSCFDPRLHVEGVFEGPCEQRREDAWSQLELARLEGAEALGVDLPRCSPDGKFHRVQTKGHTKVCVDPEGNQLEDFAVDVDNTNATGMNCNCARTRWVLGQAGLAELPACAANGNFRPLQCFRGKCFCVDDDGNQRDREVDADSVGSLVCQPH